MWEQIQMFFYCAWKHSLLLFFLIVNHTNGDLAWSVQRFFFSHDRRDIHWAQKHVVGRAPVGSYVYNNVWRIPAVFCLVTAILCMSYRTLVTTEILDAARRILRRTSTRESLRLAARPSGFLPLSRDILFRRPFSRISQVMDATPRRRIINERSLAINHLSSATALELCSFANPYNGEHISFRYMF